MNGYKQTRLGAARQSLDVYYKAAQKYIGTNKHLVYKTMGLIAHDRCLDGTNTRTLGAPV